MIGTIPIIKLDLQFLKHSVLRSIPELQGQMDTAVKLAVENFCTEENINKIVQEQVNREIESILKQSVGQFFTYNSAGRNAILEAVVEKLEYRYQLAEDLERAPSPIRRSK